MKTSGMLPEKCREEIRAKLRRNSKYPHLKVKRFISDTGEDWVDPPRGYWFKDGRGHELTCIRIIRKSESVLNDKEG